jgi:hypothetical protein
MMQGAVFATTLRDPVDRWYSQYRFEHVEKRDNSQGTKSFGDWYRENKRWTMGENYYIKTFVGTENPPDDEVLKRRGPKGNPVVHGEFYWTYNKFRGPELKWEEFESALDVVLRFHVVLILEWLDDSQGMLRELLNWQEAPRQVLPHESQAKRANKKSKSAKDTLPPEVYKVAREGNALDYLFFDFTRRIFLERLACGPVPKA